MKPTSFDNQTVVKHFIYCLNWSVFVISHHIFSYEIGNAWLNQVLMYSNAALYRTFVFLLINTKEAGNAWPSRITMFVYREYAWVYVTFNFTRGFLHALTIPQCLHAVSITHRFHSWSFTHCFYYTHIPFPHKRLYPPFPLHAHSVFPFHFWTLEGVPNRHDGCSCSCCCYRFRKMPQALLIRNGKLRNLAHTHSWNHSPVSYTHLTLPTNREV